MKKICITFLTILMAWTISLAQESSVDVEIIGISGCEPGDQTIGFNINVNYGEAQESIPEYYYFRLLIENGEGNSEDEGPNFSVNDQLRGWVQENEGWISENPNPDGFYHIILQHGPVVDDYPFLEAQGPPEITIGVLNTFEPWWDELDPDLEDPEEEDPDKDPEPEEGEGTWWGRVAVEGFSTWNAGKGLYTLDIPDAEDTQAIVCAGYERLAFNSDESSIINSPNLLWPNPARSILNISTSTNVELVNVFDMSGTLMMTHTLAKNNLLSVEHLAIGNYIIEFKNIDGSSERQRFIKL